MPEYNFGVLDSSVISDHKKWINLWLNSPERDVFSHPDYLRLYLDNNEIAHFAYCSDGTHIVAYAFVRRPIDFLKSNEFTLYDIVSPYGYGGLQVIGPGGSAQNSKTISKFWDQLTKWAEQKNIVSDFVRLQLQNPVNETYPGKIRNRSVNIVRDLKLSWEEIWSDFEKKVRKDIRKAESLGVTVTIDEDGKHLKDFLAIYFSTLDRREASKHYYFDEDFFSSLISKLKGSFVFLHAWHEGKIVSTELVLLSNTKAFSFLGGTFQESFHLHPNHLLKAEIFKWCQLNGIEEYILGGGASNGDGIEKYKKSFAPNNGEIIFQTGELIFQTNKYEELIEVQLNNAGINSEKQRTQPEFFPQYRSPEFE